MRATDGWEIAVFVVLFAAICMVGLYASRWRKADLGNLDQWGLAGRQFGGIVTWFLQGGSIYTTYSFIAVPALVYGTGVLGFYAMPYLVLAFLVQFLLLPSLWKRGKEKGHVTPADFVKERFNSPVLTSIIALTGILSLIPYVALQVYGIQICLSEIGIPVQVAVIYIPIHLGGYAHVISAVPKSKLTLPGDQYASFVTLAVGSGLALFLYPHSVTGSLSSKGPDVVRTNSITLPIYTIMLGLLGMLGYMAIAAGIDPSSDYGPNIVVPALFQKEFAPPFAGFALAAIAIGALVPASVMSISAGNLFARNLYRLARPDATPKREATASKLAAFGIKFLAVIFIVTIPSTFVINYQLVGGVWILQTLPTLFLAPWMRFMDKRWVLAGWAVGMGWGTWILAQDHFNSTLHHFDVLGIHTVLFVGIPAVVLNLIVALGGSGVTWWWSRARSGNRPVESVLVPKAPGQ